MPSWAPLLLSISRHTVQTKVHVPRRYTLRTSPRILTPRDSVPAQLDALALRIEVFGCTPMCTRACCCRTRGPSTVVTHSNCCLIPVALHDGKTIPLPSRCRGGVIHPSWPEDESMAPLAASASRPPVDRPNVRRSHPRVSSSCQPSTQPATSAGSPTANTVAPASASHIRRFPPVARRSPLTISQSPQSA